MINQQRLWDEDAAKNYDTPGEGMFDPAILGPTVEVLSSLAGGGPALEFAIGTGRVAIPLAAAGVPVSGIDSYDVLRQHVGSHHVRFGPELSDGRDARIGRTPHRYIWPSELDLMARLAGFELESRWADWDRGDFNEESRSHVSVYRLTAR